MAPDLVLPEPLRLQSQVFKEQWRHEGAGMFPNDNLLLATDRSRWTGQPPPYSLPPDCQIDRSNSTQRRKNTRENQSRTNWVIKP
jgi:hypothetical protein